MAELTHTDVTVASVKYAGTTTAGNTRWTLTTPDGIKFTTAANSFAGHEAKNLTHAMERGERVDITVGGRGTIIGIELTPTCDECSDYADAHGEGCSLNPANIV